MEQQIYEEKRYLRQGKFAKHIGVSQATIKNWIDVGLPAFRPSPAVVLIPLKEGIEWVENRERSQNAGK